MDSETVSFYRQFIYNTESLAKGYEIIKQYLSSPENRMNSLMNLLHHEVPIIVLIGNVYPLEVYPLIGEEEKEKTRKYLLELLYGQIMTKNLKNRESIFLFLDKIHNGEGYSEWTQLYF